MCTSNKVISLHFGQKKRGNKAHGGLIQTKTDTFSFSLLCTFYGCNILLFSILFYSGCTAIHNKALYKCKLQLLFLFFIPWLKKESKL